MELAFRVAKNRLPFFLLTNPRNVQRNGELLRALPRGWQMTLVTVGIARFLSGKAKSGLKTLRSVHLAV